MKKIITRIGALVVCLILLIGALPVNAASGTYTYSIDGDSLPSPDAYTPAEVVDSAKIKGLETALNSPTDIETDSDNNIYIADPNNNRIVVISEYYQYKFEISTFINCEGVNDSLNTPKGVFIWEGYVPTTDPELDADENGNLDGYYNAKHIYVADTENARLVVFDGEGEYIRHIEEPESEVFEENEMYKPVALAVDNSGRIYVVSSTTYQGIMALSSEGEFAGYIGATKVTYSALQLIWRKFQTAEQLAKQEKLISTEYNNITIDEDGFIYVTTNSIEENTLSNAINSNDASYAPVKKLNTNGTDIMRRNGFFIPAGEINFQTRVFDESATGPSSIVDVALGDEGTWSVIDSKRSKIYTYDNNGELLFAFGDMGSQMGNLKKVVGITYLNGKMMVLDGETSSFTVYKRTEYGDLLITALSHQNNRQYNLAEEDWKAILQRNNNFDAAYIGLGQAYYRMGDWEKAMSYFEFAYATERYSEAFAETRKEWVEDYILLVPVVAIVLIVAVVLFFKYAGKVNKKAATSGKKKTYWEELLYAFHVIFHPFDGFWDMKHEKRGSLRAAFTILGLAAVVFAWQAIGQSFIFNPRGGYASIIGQLTGMLLPLILWVTSNWCLTTLFDGEGSFKDIFTACAYSLTPVILLIPPATILTHIVTLSEQGFVNLLISVCYVWLFMLLFFGTMVTHDYSLGKNILTVLGTILVMCVIMFVAVLFSGLLIKMASFISNIITEIQFRM